MKIFDLYQIADVENIEIIDIDLPLTGSMSIMNENLDCYIGIDNKKIETSKEKKTKLAHEIGHCIKGAFYNRHSKLDLISKHEYSADKWACEQLLPKEKVQEAFELGYIEVWQIAEYFDVTEDLVKKAMWIYFDKEII